MGLDVEIRVELQAPSAATVSYSRGESPVRGTFLEVVCGELPDRARLQGELYRAKALIGIVYPHNFHCPELFGTADHAHKAARVSARRGNEEGDHGLSGVDTSRQREYLGDILR